MADVTTMGWLALLLFWLVCAVISYGLLFAYSQREFWSIADRHYKRDRRFALNMALFGPLGLLAFFVVTGCTHGRHLFKHGVKWS